MDRDKLRETLAQAEDRRRLPYDDRTGTTVKAGSLIVGTLTIGVGHSLAKPLSDAAIDLLLEEDIDEAIATLDKLCPWWTDLDEPRQQALCELSFQLGATRLQEFAPTLLLIHKRDFDAAARHLRHSLLAQQCPRRTTRLSEIIRTGHESLKA
jgi:lysozyme